MKVQFLLSLIALLVGYLLVLLLSNSKGEDMVQAGEGANGTNGSNDMYKWSIINSGNLYFEEDAFAGLLGGINDFYSKNTKTPFANPLTVDKVLIFQFMSLDRVHSYKTDRNACVGVSYYNKDGSVGSLTTYNSFSDKINTQLYNSFTKFGLGSKAVYTSIGAESKTKYFSFTKGSLGHHDHFHFDGFSKNVGTQLPGVNIYGFKGWSRLK